LQAPVTLGDTARLNLEVRADAAGVLRAAALADTD